MLVAYISEADSMIYEQRLYIPISGIKNSYIRIDETI